MPPKKPPRTASRSLILIVLILIGTNIATVYYFTFIDQQNLSLDIGDVTGESAEQYIGQTVTIAGYLVQASEFVFLVTNPLHFWENFLNASNHMLVTGIPSSSMPQLVGRWVEVTGAVYYESDQQGGLVGIEYQSHEVAEPDTVAFQGCRDTLVSAADLEDLVGLIDTNSEKYAVLYSGGIRSFYAYYRYWNDLVWMYWTLLIFGYDSDNIFVVYKDGLPENSEMPVHFPATSAAMDELFANLSAEMGSADSLFFYTSNHGSEDGLYEWDPTEFDPDLINQLTHTQIADWLDSITCHHMMIIMGQCYSGAYLPYLSAPNRIIMTASDDDESSWSCDDEGEWDEFLFHFISALLQFQINGDGVPVWADITNNGRVSLAEAFGYAATMDSRDETPLYDDNGDGIASTLGNIVGTDSDFGNDIYL